MKREMIVCLALICVLAGCRATPPPLEPEKTADRLIAPPGEGRYDKAEMPREVFDDVNAPRPLSASPRSSIPTSGIGSRSASGMGPYKF